jgi:signal transduction histidine kinase
MIRLKISSKLLLYFLIVSLVPLLTVSVVLTSSGKSLLLRSAITRQQIVADNTAVDVDAFLGSKISALTFQAEIYALNRGNDSTASQNLAIVMKQDKNLEQLSVVDSKGNEQVVFTQKGQSNDLTNMSSSDAFKAVSYLQGKNFVGPVTHNSDGEPQLTIAVPVLRSNLNQHLNNLPSASFDTYASSSDFLGVIIAKYNITGLWQSVLSTKVGQGGYAYVVDGLGNLVAHPDKKYLLNHQNITNVQAVNRFINGNFTTRQTTSEIGTQVISTPKELKLTNWAVIVEEPVSSVYAGIHSFTKLSAIIICSSIVFAILVSLVLRKQLLDPIKKLSAGAKTLVNGSFVKLVEVNTNDELQDLATSFNNMALSIRKLVGDLRVKNVDLNIEQIKLNNIIRSVSDGVIALDSQFRIISINPPAAKLIKRKPEDLVGKVLDDLYLFSNDGKEFNPELKKPGTYHYTDLVLQTGNDVSYLDIMVSVLDSSESEATVIITVHDLTQSRELEFMKLDFVAIAAHELRTPLTVVQGYLSILNDDALRQLSLSNLENLQKAIVGTDQLRNLINKLLNISRIERGEMEVSIQKLELTRLVKDSVKAHQGAAAQKLQSVVYSANTEKSVYVPGDSSSLSEVLNNLIGNALKFTEMDGTVHVNLIADKDQVRVEVIDTGPGVRLDLQARLFTKFYRAERSLVSGYRGTGLGLYISKTIIDMHHGKIGIEPDTSKGSTFYFTLPIYDPKKHDILLSNEARIGGIRGWFKKNSTS